MDGLTRDPLFVGATRPPMRFGVTYAALLLNLIVTMELFLATKNLLVLLVAVFGPAGLHARSVVGVSSLRKGLPLTIRATVEVKRK